MVLSERLAGVSDDEQVNKANQSFCSTLKLRSLIVSKVALHVKARRGAYVHEVLGESA